MGLRKRQRTASRSDAVRFHLQDIRSVVTDKQVPGSSSKRNIGPRDIKRQSWE